MLGVQSGCCAFKVSCDQVSLRRELVGYTACRGLQKDALSLGPLWAFLEAYRLCISHSHMILPTSQGCWATSCCGVTTTHCVPGIVQSTLHGLTHLILSTSLWMRWNGYFCFMMSNRDSERWMTWLKGTVLQSRRTGILTQGVFISEPRLLTVMSHTPSRGICGGWEGSRSQSGSSNTHTVPYCSPVTVVWHSRVIPCRDYFSNTL